ncbi:MAG: ATP-binding cassette domain-containing protein [Chlorobiaceae bacterium]
MSSGATEVGTFLDIGHATAYRGSTRVFEGLSLKIDEGCNTAILGPNGSGKSTLLKLISKEIYPVADPGSHVRVFGRDRWNLEELRCRLGIVSHDLQHSYLSGARGVNVVLSGFYGSIDTWQNQEFSGEDLEKAEAVMQRLGISELRGRAFGSMSTGQQRRFLLGRALINNPDALLFDEPTTGLDLKGTSSYLETLRMLMHEGKTVLLVTHHLHEIPPEIDRVVMLKEGQTLRDGKKGEVLTSELLSELFDCPLDVASANGWYQVLPAG